MRTKVQCVLDSPRSFSFAPVLFVVFTPGSRTMTEKPLPPLYARGNFPVQLHHLLDDMVTEGMEHIASWQPHGRCFKVHDRKAFVDSILHRYDSSLVTV
jgi:hypothetical protein